MQRAGALQASTGCLARHDFIVTDAMLQEVKMSSMFMRTLIGDGRRDGLDGGARSASEVERERASALALWASSSLVARGDGRSHSERRKHGSDARAAAG